MLVSAEEKDKSCTIGDDVEDRITGDYRYERDDIKNAVAPWLIARALLPEAGDHRALLIGDTTTNIDPFADLHFPPNGQIESDLIELAGRLSSPATRRE